MRASPRSCAFLVSLASRSLMRVRSLAVSATRVSFSIILNMQQQARPSSVPRLIPLSQPHATQTLGQQVHREVVRVEATKQGWWTQVPPLRWTWAVLCFA